MAPKQKPHRSKQDYETPWEFVHAVERDWLGGSKFAIDLAASAQNSKSETAFIDEKENSLTVNWRERYPRDTWAWLNPPFSKIAVWARKCSEMYQERRGIVMLVPASVGSNWFYKYVHERAYVLFLNGRIAFDPTHPKWGYPKDCMLCIYGGGYEPGFDVWNWRK